MPTYEYRCDCGEEWAEVQSIAAYSTRIGEPLCSTIGCPGITHRVYEALPFTLPIEGHYNPAVGRYVSSRKDLADALKQGGEAAYLRTGIENDYQVTDLRDTDRHGVTGEGLEETARVRHDGGRPTGIYGELTKD